MPSKPTGKPDGLIKPPKKQSLLVRWRGSFLTGLVIVAPVVLTIYLTWTLITFVDSKIVPWLPENLQPQLFGFDIPGFGVLVFVILTAIVGTSAKNLFGRQLIRIGESWVDRMPVIRTIYNALKQISETILSQSKTSFQNACLVQYPREGIWAIAFVSTSTKGEIMERAGEEDMVSIFLPTTPNPTSGFLLFVPRRDVVMLSMTVEEAAKLVISAGLVTPPTTEERAAGVAVRSGAGARAPAKPAARRTASAT